MACLTMQLGAAAPFDYVTDEDLAFFEHYCLQTEGMMLDEVFRDGPAPRMSVLKPSFVDPDEEAALLDWVFET